MNNFLGVTPINMPSSGRLHDATDTYAGDMQHTGKHSSNTGTSNDKDTL